MPLAVIAIQAAGEHASIVGEVVVVRKQEESRRGVVAWGTAVVNNDAADDAALNISVAAVRKIATRYTNSLHFVLLMRDHLVESSDKILYVFSY